MTNRPFQIVRQIAHRDIELMLAAGRNCICPRRDLDR